MTELSASDWRPYLIAAVAAIAVAGLGAWATQLGPWYYNLKKPTWQPPDWVFGPAWTLIFGLIAISAGLAWEHSPDNIKRAWIVVLFALNGVLNILWSVFFFTLEKPGWALIEVIFLWLSIIVLMVFIAPISAVASWFLSPYLVWVTFAALLNLAIVRLNLTI